MGLNEWLVLSRGANESRGVEHSREREVHAPLFVWPEIDKGYFDKLSNPLMISGIVVPDFIFIARVTIQFCLSSL